MSFRGVYTRFLLFFAGKKLYINQANQPLMFGFWSCVGVILKTITWGTPSSRAASTKLSNNCSKDPAEMTWQFTKSAIKRTKYLASSHFDPDFKHSFKFRMSNSTHSQHWNSYGLPARPICYRTVIFSFCWIDASMGRALMFRLLSNRNIS